MKYVVYILTTLLAAVSVLILGQFIVLLSVAPETDVPISDYRLAFWMSAAFMGATAVMAVLQLFRSTPRLMLLFAGAAACHGLSLAAGHGVPMIIAASQWTSGEGIQLMTWLFGVSLLMLAAGLLPALYERFRYVRMVKAQPKHTVKRGLLITAAVLACVNLALSLLRTASISSIIFHSEALLFVLPSYILGLLFDVGLLVSCFMMKRRTGALYRMFFIGPIALEAVTTPIMLVSFMQLGFIDFSSLAAHLILLIVKILAAVFVIIHVAKHRHEDFTILPPPPYEKPAASHVT